MKSARTFLTTVAIPLLLGTGSCAPFSLQGVGDSTENALMELGRVVFIELSEPQCGACHVLRDAGTSGMIGPDLDELAPDIDRVMTAVTGGVGVMAAQDHLTDQQIAGVALDIARRTNGAD
ncbi:MAG: cytochrome c [Gemmatimonadetes bacterium]|nr:cytochrome c [Gemmatimonadota bacterium]